MNKFYNFIAVHLYHGQNKRIKRDNMMSDLIKCDKFRIIDRKEIDSDVFCDYNFIMGDLNYRFNSTF